MYTYFLFFYIQSYFYLFCKKNLIVDYKLEKYKDFSKLKSNSMVVFSNNILFTSFYYSI